MDIQTKRLLLRPWHQDDAAALYALASNPNIGPRAGWPIHTSVENSKEIIQTILSAPGTFAIVIRETGQLIGSIALMDSKAAHIPLDESEKELGYWIGEPFWGAGYTPEAAQALLKFGFEDLSLNSIWCGHFKENIQSHRVIEKCGFTYVRDIEQKAIDQSPYSDIVCYYKLSRQDWIER